MQEKSSSQNESILEENANYETGNFFAPVYSGTFRPFLCIFLTVLNQTVGQFMCLNKTYITSRKKYQQNGIKTLARTFLTKV